MGRRWKRLLVCLCAAALAVGMLAGTRASADEVEIYLMAENDKMLDLPLEAMPAWIGGSMYVPYHAFDWSYTGVNLGVSYGQNRTASEFTFTLYSLSGTLLFDLNEGTCVEQSTGDDMDMKAVVRSGRVFVPLAGVCRYFGLSYSYTPTSYGTLIRITNGQESLSTVRFVESATNAMRTRYNEYIKAMGGTSTPKPSPTQETAVPSPTPSGEQEGSGSTRELTLSLAFQCSGTGAGALLDTLEGAGVKALFLFAPEALADNGAAIRQAVATGHLVGLSVSGSDLEEIMAELEEGSRWLEEVLWLRPHLVYLKAETAGTASALEQAGWAVWRADVDGRDDGRGQSVQRTALLASLEREQGQARVLLDDSANGTAMLQQTLNRMFQAGYRFDLDKETDG